MTDPAKQLGQMFIDAIDMNRAVDALMLDETKCESCGLTLNRVNGVWLMHPECDPNPDERAAYQALGDRV